MKAQCRTCRFWRPYDLWGRDPECEGSAICGFRDAVDWDKDGGDSVPPWVNGSYWCRHHRKARLQLAKMYLLDRRDKLVEWLKYNPLTRRYREWKWQRRSEMEER